MRADKIRILPDQSLQRNNGQIRASAFGIGQGLIVFLDRLVHIVQMILVIPERREPFVRRVIVHLQVLADDPLAERFRHFARFIIDQPEKIPRFGMILIQLQAEAEHLRCPGQVPQACLFKARIIITVRQADDLFIFSDIRSAAQTVTPGAETAAALITIH